MLKLIRRSALLVVLLAVSVAHAAATVDMKDPYKMLNEVATKTFNLIQANHDKMTDRDFRINLIRTELMPYVDIRYASFKVIGNNYKQTTKEQRDNFISAFEIYIINSFADALGKYDKQQLVNPPYQKIADTEKLTTMKFLIREEGKQDLELVFKLRRNAKTGEWRVFDMIAENISLLQAKQSELGPLIRDQGIDSVTQMLKEKK